MVPPTTAIKGPEAGRLALGQTPVKLNGVQAFREVLEAIKAPLTDKETADKPVLLPFYDPGGTEPLPKQGSALAPPREGVESDITPRRDEAPLEPGSHWIEPVTGLFLGMSNAAGLDAPIAAAGLGASSMPIEIVRSIAWGGDRRRGTARIELGAGRFAGATLVVSADGDQLSIVVELPGGADAEELTNRLTRRFAEKGLLLRELSVR